jgi:hypothetical protein
MRYLPDQNVADIPFREFPKKPSARDLLAGGLAYNIPVQMDVWSANFCSLWQIAASGARLLMPERPLT